MFENIHNFFKGSTMHYLLHQWANTFAQKSLAICIFSQFKRDICISPLNPAISTRILHENVLLIVNLSISNQYII
jgi:hypothetical protein